MNIQDNKQSTRIGVAGVGLMGSSIAACLLSAGHEVVGVEIQQQSRDVAFARVREHLEKMKIVGLDVGD
jgi:3-hydroxybutyryl-CoA dehydrogenase